jgi:hypothetical protein
MTIKQLELPSYSQFAIGSFHALFKKKCVAMVLKQ